MWCAWQNKDKKKLGERDRRQQPPPTRCCCCPHQQACHVHTRLSILQLSDLLYSPARASYSMNYWLVLTISHQFSTGVDSPIYTDSVILYRRAWAATQLKPIREKLNQNDNKIYTIIFILSRIFNFFEIF